MDAALVTGAFFMLGISAWYVYKGQHFELAKQSLKTSLIVAFIGSVLQLGLGHFHAVQVAHTQPEKLAAFEGIFDTQTSAPALLFGIPDEEKETVHKAIRIPGVLSLMAFGRFGAEVKGLKDYPKEDRPPVALTFYPFHLMVALGMYFILFSGFGTFLLWKKKLLENRLFMALAMLSIPLPFIANELGWMTAEIGRQPWIVYHLLRTRDGYSATVPAGQVLLSIIMFSLIYVLLFCAWVFLLRREVRRGPENGEAQPKEAQI
jgi:cytochrome d ubiquinol oxidase subunit I